MFFFFFFFFFFFLGGIFITGPNQDQAEKRRVGVKGQVGVGGGEEMDSPQFAVTPHTFVSYK